MTSCGDQIESLVDSAITQQLTEFSAPGRYMFTVTTLKDTRNASASVVIEVSSDTVPTVGIAAPALRIKAASGALSCAAAALRASSSARIDSIDSPSRAARSSSPALHETWLLRQA